MGVTGNLDKSSFGGTMRMEAQVEKVKGRIRGREVITVTRQLFI